MLKGRGRQPVGVTASSPPHQPQQPKQQPQQQPQQQPPRAMSSVPSSSRLTLRTPTGRAPVAKPEPDYEVVEFPSDQYVNAKLQPPPPPPPRPPTGHPVEAGASCGLCGGGGARVRCAECGRRALCASCDDMYHRHPKRRHHQRQALPVLQIRDERPPLLPKGTPPVPPPRRHKISGDRMSASPRPPSADPRSSTLNSPSMMHAQNTMIPPSHLAQLTNRPTMMPVHLQGKMMPMASMPYLPSTMHHNAPVSHNTMGPMSGWNRPRGSMPGFDVHSNMHLAPQHESWDSPEMGTQGWGRPLRRGASVLELGMGASGAGCGAACSGWRYGSCASLEQPWGWPPQGPPQACCAHAHPHAPYTPQPYRRAESRAASRAASRACSRAASPAGSARSRTSRRARRRSPAPVSPPPLPSSDADSDTASSDAGHTTHKLGSYMEKPSPVPRIPDTPKEESLGPVPAAPVAAWQCEHCTFVNEPGQRVCAVCCRTPLAAPKIVEENATRPSNEQANIDDSVRAVSDTADSIARLRIHDSEPLSARTNGKVPVQNGVTKPKTASKSERVSTGCGPSPPREEIKRTINRLVTPTREQSMQSSRSHDIAVGASPPKEVQTRATQDTGYSPKQEVTRHSVSVGCSPPREDVRGTTKTINQNVMSTKTSPPRSLSRANTGTSPPPQNISTQTYEVPSTWVREASRPRSRRHRDERDPRRERSHSRHSLSSDTRESERTSGGVGEGGGRWEWRDSSPGADWSGSERRRGPRLARRASHLDLRRTRPAAPPRSAYCGSEAASPERSRAMSLEALAGTTGGGAAGALAAERGLELARLMAEAERLGFSAAEVRAAVSQSPRAPLQWLRERWPGLCAGVRAAAARLEPRARLSHDDARAALARSRGALWPAVTDCVERHRRLRASGGEGGSGGAGRMSGRVWGSPAGVEDDAAPPRADGSSDEFDDPHRADWKYLPLDASGRDPVPDLWASPARELFIERTAFDFDPRTARLSDEALLDELLSYDKTNYDNGIGGKSNLELIQSENDFIDAYNALTRTTPLPAVDGRLENNTNAEFKYTNHDNYSSPIVSDKTKYINEHRLSEQEPVLIEVPENNYQLIEETRPKLEIATVETQNNQASDNVIKGNIENRAQLNISQHRTQNDSILTENSTQNQDINTLIDQSKSVNNNRINNLENPNEEKSNNLNDIVDNTQKLIQQMKAEINLDISSIDSRNISQSEAETSSNESDISTERESNYSESDDDETENLSTEEETSSSDSIENQTSARRPTIVERTSSEENDQFEEAMDHIEGQIEDFKYTNIEILDSIARSLQEQDSVAVGRNKPKIENGKNQDRNNNIFVKVNSFEEIYDEINTSENAEINTSENAEINTSEKAEINTNHNGVINSNKILQFNRNNNAEFNINKNPENSINSNPGINANNNANINTIYDAEINTNIDAEIITNDYSEINSTENITNEKSYYLDNPNHSPNQDIIILENDYTVPDAVNIDLPKHAVVIGTMQTVFPTMLIISENVQSIYNAVLDSVEADINTENITSLNDNSHIPLTISFQANVVNNANDSSQSSKNEELLNSILTHTPTEQNNRDINDIATNTAANIITENIEANNNEDILDKNISEDVPEIDNINTPPKEIISKTDVSSTKILNSNKSNIPKLIKLVQTNKQRGEKTSHNVISSKVPVRRTSLKQYPAPPPPKSHFGNIQSGHVKQLQTRLFNNKFPKTAVNIKTSVDVKPSTSTLQKKKQAPPPPTAVPVQSSPVNEKKSKFFRESCRTEDEWTESDSGDSQGYEETKEIDEPEQTKQPTPPPPVTLRRVSGQLVDLAKVQIPEGSPERQARMLLAQGATETWEQARLAAELAARGAAPAAALLAALECADLAAALVYLHQDCELCAARLPEHEMVSMLRCTHRCCRECAQHYFTVQVTERSIADCVCPFCKAPELEALPEDEWLDYFAHLDIFLKTLLAADVHELFQRKLRDRTLARDPNFRWCVECSSGFFVHPKQKKIRCPECRSVSCAKCRKPWSTNHEGLSCEQYEAWLEDNNPERSTAAVQQHLRENGLECPRCHFKYSLSRGGCMHFTCTQCKYEFCYGCGKPFMMGARCGLSEYCARLGLHAHHPRNCLFYLRDKEPHQLQTLLQMNNVPYETEAPAGSSGRCPVPLQRETPAGLVDGLCGADVPPHHAGLCQAHYVERLGAAARAARLDPLPIMDAAELVAELRRRALPPPERGPWDTDPIYAGMCAEIVKEKIPLD